MATMQQLLARKQVLESKINPLVQQRNALALQAAAIEDEMKELAFKIKRIQGNELFEINNEIADLARQAGAKSMRAA